MRWLRFNFTTGDAAGQNMVTKATHELSLDPRQRPRGLRDFALAATRHGQEASALNNLHSRGKRVVAEATILLD